MVYRKIQNILQETAERIERLYIPYENEFMAQFRYLNMKEKDIIRQFLYTHEWNLGSARVLAMFKAADVITASEYVLRLHSKDTIHIVMNDLLEAEHVLLGELISNSCLDIEISTTLKEILQECFRSALEDLLENPNIIPCNYLDRLKAYLPATELNHIRQQHFQLLLEKGGSGSLEEAIGRQVHWRTEAGDRSRTVLGQLMREVVQDHACAIESLFRAAKTRETISWMFFLNLLSLVAVSIGEDKVEILRIKGIMKEMFLQIVDGGDFEQFVLLMLVARELCAANESILGKYSSWYKATLGEMSYRISKEQFIRVMEMLTKLITLEKDSELVKVHVNISISTPPKCMELVVTYKQLGRAQLAKLENEKNRSGAARPIEDHETSIVIDDDD